MPARGGCTKEVHGVNLQSSRGTSCESPATGGGHVVTSTFAPVPRRGINFRQMTQRSFVFLLSFSVLHRLWKSLLKTYRKPQIFSHPLWEILLETALFPHTPPKANKLHPNSTKLRPKISNFQHFPKSFQQRRRLLKKILPVEKSSVLPNRKGHPFRMTFSHVYSFSIVI